MKKDIIIKKPHSKDCFLVKKNNEYYFPKDFFFGNYAGNNIRGYHYWLEMGCNNPKCQYKAVISLDKINSLLTPNTQ